MLELLQKLNSNRFNLTFTMDYSLKRVSFFDVDINLQANGYLKSSLYRKPTTGNTILRANSSHPSSLVRSIPFSQYLHLRRICSSDSDFREQASLLQQRLLDHGYSRSLLKKALNEDLERNRENLIYHKKDKNPDDITRYILAYNSHHSLRSVFSIVLLKEDPILKNYLPEYPSITYKTSRSLKDHLVSSYFSDGTQLDLCKKIGTFPCGNCEYCHCLDTGTKATLQVIPPGKQDIMWDVRPRA